MAGICGGTGGVQHPDETTHEVVAKVRPEVEQKCGRTFTLFDPVTVRTQLVAGMNYFVKVKVGDGEFVHLRIYKTLQGDVHLHGVQTAKGENDALDYFEQEAPRPPGAAGDVRAPDQTTHDVVAKVRPDVEKKCGKTFPEFQAVAVKTQVVAGTNYFVKVAVGGGSFMHLRIYQTLQGEVHLHGVQADRSQNDALEYFEQSHQCH